MSPININSGIFKKDYIFHEKMSFFSKVKTTSNTNNYSKRL